MASKIPMMLVALVALVALVSASEEQEKKRFPDSPETCRIDQDKLALDCDGFKAKGFDTCYQCCARNLCNTSVSASGACVCALTKAVPEIVAFQ